VRPTSTWSWSSTARSTVTSKSSSTDPPSIDLYGSKRIHRGCIHPCTPPRADVNEARPLDRRPQRCAPCQPDGLSPTAHRTRHDPSAPSPKRTLLRASRRPREERLAGSQCRTPRKESALNEATRRH
jgi:hypothetical protein